MQKVLAEPEVVSCYLGTGCEALVPRVTPHEVKEDASPILTLDHVSAGYGHFKALNDISFDVHHGEVVALLGTNGAGKTTAARVISGMIPATAGRITLRTARTSPRSPSHDVARLGLAHCMEGRHIFADLTVHENLVLAGRRSRRTACRTAWTASTTCSRCWPSGATSRASSSRAASSRCWPSAAR